METRAAVEFRDLTDLVKWLKIALAVLAIIGLVGAYSSWLHLALVGEVQNGGANSPGVSDPNDLRQSLVALTYFLVYLVTAVLFLRWTYLAKRNVLALGGTNQAISPGWSVGYYFIPIVTLWKPYQALREAFEGSHPDRQYTWNEPSRPALMPLWWGLWLVSGFVDNASLRITDPRTAAWSSILENLVKLPLIAVVWILVSTMLDWQTTKSKSSIDSHSSQLPAVAKD